MDHVVGTDLQADEKQRDYGEDHLKAFGALLPGTEFAPAPLGRGARPEMPDPSQDSQVQERACGGKD